MTDEAVTVMADAIDSTTITATVEIAKNLYTRLYIYAKPEALLYKYTVAMAVLRGAISTKIPQTRTIFGAIGAVGEHREGRKSNNPLQNSGIQRLFRRYFWLRRG